MIDPHRYIKKVYSNVYCTVCGRIVLKDLRRICSDLNKIVIMDNNISCFYLQFSNGLWIKSFLGDEGDSHLLTKAQTLMGLKDTADVRNKLSTEFEYEKLFGYYVRLKN